MKTLFTKAVASAKNAPIAEAGGSPGIAYEARRLD